MRRGPTGPETSKKRSHGIPTQETNAYFSTNSSGSSPKRLSSQKLNKDQSSVMLFCNGVPVSKSRDMALNVPLSPCNVRYNRECGFFNLCASSTTSRDQDMAPRALAESSNSSCSYVVTTTSTEGVFGVFIFGFFFAAVFRAIRSRFLASRRDAWLPW